MTDRQERTARRASRIFPKKVSSGSASLGTRFRNQSWMAGCAAVFLHPARPGIRGGWRGRKASGQSGPSRAPASSRFPGAGGEELHRVRQAAQGLHDASASTRDLLPGQVHHDGADYHPRRRKPVEVRDLLQTRSMGRPQSKSPQALFLFMPHYGVPQRSSV